MNDHAATISISLYSSLLFIVLYKPCVAHYSDYRTISFSKAFVPEIDVQVVADTKSRLPTSSASTELSWH